MVTDTIKQLVRKYNSLNTGEGINLPLLLELRKLLSCASFELAIEVAKYKKKFDRAYAERKSKFAEVKLNALSNGNTIGGSDILAEKETSLERTKIAENESNYMAGRIILEQVNQILSSMQQEISILKKELEHGEN